MNLTTRIERLYRYPVKLRDLLRDDTEGYRRESYSEDQEKGGQSWERENKPKENLVNNFQGRSNSTLYQEEEQVEHSPRGQNKQASHVNSLSQSSLSCDEQIQYSKGKSSLLPLAKQLQERDAIQTSKIKPSPTGRTLDYVI
jgi:hypothetical protein